MKADITTVVIDQQQLYEADVWFDLSELCERCALQKAQVIELVGLGLIMPQTLASERWQFQAAAVLTLRKAVRLRYELDLDWQGVALAMELMAEVRQLRQQVTSLERQLAIR
jgi:chaperone modulatory protein CbpM